MDFFNDFVPRQTADRQVFLSPTCVSTVNMVAAGQHIWRKPKGCSFVHIFFWGSAGGGGGGRTGASGTNRSGGGGGGSAAGRDYLVPAWRLPDILYIVLGQGGTGGAANTTGTNGCLSGIFNNPPSSSGAVATPIEIITGGAGGQPGLAGTGGSGGTAGSMGGSQQISGLSGLFSASGTTLASTNGSSGGATLGGSPGTSTTGSPFYSGGGGSAVNLTAVATSGVRTPQNSPYPPWEAPSGGVVGGILDGGSYYVPPGQPFISFAGGSGAGGLDASGVGGKGGDSGPGSGGSGGGGGVTGGAGGKGGDAGIIITSF